MGPVSELYWVSDQVLGLRGGGRVWDRQDAERSSGQVSDHQDAERALALYLGVAAVAYALDVWAAVDGAVDAWAAVDGAVDA